MNDKIVSVDWKLHTNGSGLYSSNSGVVDVVGLELAVLDDEETEGLNDYGELKVRFTTASWDIFGMGLIYTDKLFMQELSEALIAIGLDPEDVYYSEQGMQWLDYVSLDAGKKFIASWIARGLPVNNHD